MPLICFASPKGGVGKTTLAANVAGALAAAGARVVALDLDPQSALGLHFGLPLFDTNGFVTALDRQHDPASWRRALRTTPAGVHLLPYGRSPLHEELANARALANDPEMLAAPLRDLLAQSGTIVIADLPPGPSAQLAAVLPLADLLVTVLLLDAASLSNIPLIESGQCYGEGIIAHPARMGFVLNQYDLRSRIGRAACEATARHFGRRLLGVIYRDESVPEAAAAQRLVTTYAPNSKAGLDIAALARNIAVRMAAPTESAAAMAASRKVPA